MSLLAKVDSSAFQLEPRRASRVRSRGTDQPRKQGAIRPSGNQNYLALDVATISREGTGPEQRV